MRQMLIFNEDLQFNQRVGMPVKVYCRTRQKTLALGGFRRSLRTSLTFQKRGSCAEII
ncbi:hypothetical protein [Geomicrobium sp. JCM 19039]|uniref:hypothetical protein n=1 Tax=Geomicrobium sp. JCM 19039 TaxID=1460636 RepID=UPI00187C8692|nr:hypothetical protein [Geomicrobium sp. JCM 19039]